jgi:hypothetical protein
MRRHLTSIPPLSAATGQLVVASILMAPFAVATSIAHGFEPTPTRMLAIVLLGVFGTGIGYVINYRLIADLGATRAALSTYIIPVVAVLVGVIALDESFSGRIVAGGLLIAVGIGAVHRPTLARRPRIPTGSTPAVLLLVVALVLVGGTTPPAVTGGRAAPSSPRTSTRTPTSTSCPTLRRPTTRRTPRRRGRTSPAATCPAWSTRSSRGPSRSGCSRRAGS